MPNYVRLEISPEKSALEWVFHRALHTNMVFFAEYRHKDSETLLRVTFQSTQVARIMEGVPLLDAEETPTSGIVRRHFGYIVEGSIFWKLNEPSLRAEGINAKHYRFITGDSCVDVISESEPKFRTLAVAK